MKVGFSLLFLKPSEISSYYYRMKCLNLNLYSVETYHVSPVKLFIWIHLYSSFILTITIMFYSDNLVNYYLKLISNSSITASSCLLLLIIFVFQVILTYHLLQCI